MSRRDRICFYNVLRVLAFAAVFFYHALMENAAEGFLAAETAARLTEGTNLHLAKTAVALFFILSGASLMYAYRDRFSVKEYYIRRISRILLPYWVSSLVIFAGHFHFHVDGNPLKLLFNVFALDGYASVIGLPAQYFTIGEWFLGCLIPMYILFPLLRRAMKARPEAVLLTATVIYAVLAVWYPFSVIPHANFCLKLYEFILGMYFAARHEAQPGGIPVFAGLFFLFLLFAPALPVPEGILTTLSAAAVFLVFAALEPAFRKMPRFMKGIDTCCRYAFEVYLVHHIVILLVIRHIFIRFGLQNTAALFLAQAAGSIVCGCVLYFVCALIRRFFRTKMVRGKQV